MEFSSTERGKPVLIYKNFEYIEWRTTKGVLSWRCRQNRKTNCHSMMKTKDDIIIQEPSAHCHDLCPQRVKANVAKRKMKEVVLTGSDSTQNVLSNILSEVSNEVLAHMPKKSSLSRNVSNYRRNVFFPNTTYPNSHIPSRLRIALLQLKCGKDKIENVENAINNIKKAIEHKPKLIALPECFNSPYGTKYFADYAETIPEGYTSQLLSKTAKEHSVFIIGGTIPEKDENNILYNTCTVWDPSGSLIAKHRKVHLFDIDVKGGIRFKESETLSAGNDFTIIEIDGNKIGIGICYDIRFEEMARIYRNEGCKMLVYPAAFNMTTGPLHWELLQRGRANDNQLFVATASPARDVKSDYVAWGHSMVVDPWGRVIDSAKEDEETIIADIDFSIVDAVREQIPVFSQRRTDIYATERRNK